MENIIQFNAPATSLVGGGAIKKLALLVKEFEVNNVMIVTDTYFVKTGLINLIVSDLQSNGINASVFSDVSPDPSLENVYHGLEDFIASKAEMIVAVGGGSPIDAAKAISVLVHNPPPLNQYMGYHKIKNPGVPVIAVPTTSGTGSEATKVAVISDNQLGVKMMIFDKHLMPAAAVVDFNLAKSMPQDLTAFVGVDTLTHGIEAFVSKKSNALSDPLAMSCINLVGKHLATAWEIPEDNTAREGMSIAAYQGGLAFTNSSVCLVHGMSRPLGAIFHLAHGFSNAMLLPAVVSFSLVGALEKYAIVSRILGFSQNSDSDEAAGVKLVDGLEKLNKKLRIPTLGTSGKIEKVKFEKNLEKMASDALASGSPQNNPIIPTMDEIISLYQKAW
ncbi:iron-containing alcohol dehydrogenase [Cognataquiflexum rubidum]|uniref:iron-containing alcohol dehydrogenase n=1 Tax=Cognataquiflexum rubidum TaxID=2922273 RepID=UPI001F14975A|nr:iron-containing alcohol dehydrogenase [Cognataquiflexum rubidum]MCH6233162.1 iron-containing alcohol dehydrogenase [Cognataquiflexum rubidum]